MPADTISEDALSIGMMIGGECDENKAFSERTSGVNDAWRIVNEVRKKAGPDDLCVNIVFDVPGRFSAPDYVGVRTGRFSKRSSSLLIMAAVPLPMTHEQEVEFAGNVLQRSKELAHEYVKKKKLALRTGALDQTIDAVLARLGHKQRDMGAANWMGRGFASEGAPTKERAAGDNHGESLGVARQQLILQFAEQSMDDFERLVALEVKIEQLELLGVEVDGHDTGSGTHNIFLFTKDSKQTFNAIRTRITLSEQDAKSMKAAFRNVDSDEDADELHILWPPGLTQFDYT